MTYLDMLPTIIMAGIIAYQQHCIRTMDTDIDNLIEKHNEFVVTTQTNLTIIKEAVIDLAEAVDDLQESEEDDT